MAKSTFLVIVIVIISALWPRSRQNEVSDPLPSLQGEWLIVEVGGEPVPGEAAGAEGGPWGVVEEQPWVGFDVRSGRVWGSGGCNRLLGTISIDEPSGTVDFGPGMGSTKRLCADMRLEDAILAAFAGVRRFAYTAEGRVALTDSAGHTVMLLSAKNPQDTLEDN